MRILTALKRYMSSLVETIRIASVPGMKEKLLEGIKTPFSECLSDDEVWGDSSENSC